MVALGNNHFTALDVAKISICGSVTPTALNTILFINVVCRKIVMTEPHRYVYIYQELESCMHLFELEVASKWD